MRPGDFAQFFLKNGCYYLSNPAFYAQMLEKMRVISIIKHLINLHILKNQWRIHEKEFE